jgi:hypothetical protein
MSVATPPSSPRPDPCMNPKIISLISESLFLLFTLEIPQYIGLRGTTTMSKMRGMVEDMDP